MFLYCFDSSTGDEVVMREDGTIYIVDRLKHIINHKVKSSAMFTRSWSTYRALPTRDFK